MIEELRRIINERPAMVWSTRAPSTMTGTSYYDRCPCNPANGGSGICGCIRGTQQITC